MRSQGNVCIDENTYSMRLKVKILNQIDFHKLKKT